MLQSLLDDLRAYVKCNGSIRQAAARLAVSPSTLHAWITGARTPGRFALEYLADKLRHKG